MNYNSFDLEKIRKERVNFPIKTLFPHQAEALNELNLIFNFKDNKPKSGLIVIPTGGGKTFTAVKWICEEVLPRDIKVLWFAHSFHLLDQAAETFFNTFHEIPEKRKILNLRIVSSNPEHCQISDINEHDDVLIVTTPSAITNFEINALDKNGKKVQSSFRKFLNKQKDERIMVVLDEAHHAPAYGCRKLLMDLKNLIPRLYILGLTATPSYTDITRRGWLSKIFEDGIIYEAKKQNLLMQKILARENYIQRQTNFEQEVDQKLYERLVIEHKDIPEDIIEILANNSPRNDMIVNEYVKNKNYYGKTIIFADRWFQCIYLKDKLSKHGIKADAVYSHIDADPGSAEARNKRDASENQKIIEDYKKDKIKVLINVRMLTEGTDVPNTQTVFITRNTTSRILLTQMIGRALRGEKAGGGLNKGEAKIVLFNDTWKKYISWATPDLEGGVEDNRIKYEPRPIQYISINLIEKLCKQINSGQIINSEAFDEILPIGWYQSEFTIDVSENKEEELNSTKNIILVYNSNKDSFQNLINSCLKNLPDDWKKEKLPDEWLENHGKTYLNKYFNIESDNFGDNLLDDIINILRHIGQNEKAPDFISFDERERYDIDKLAEQLRKMYPDEQYQALLKIYEEPGSIWKELYRTFPYFQTAVQASLNRLVNIKFHGLTSNVIFKTVKITKNDYEREPRELSEEEKEQIKKRDGQKCLSCGVEKGRGIKLQIDHILPVKLNGDTSIENSQTLCHYCNNYKDINEINFRITKSTLSVQKPELIKIPPANFDDLKTPEGVTRSLKRIINFYYHCNSVANIKLNIRSTGGFYKKWEIELYAGNNPKWLINKKNDLLDYIQKDLGKIFVKDVIIYGLK